MRKRKFEFTDAESWLLAACVRLCNVAASYKGGWLSKPGFDRVFAYLKARYGTS